MCMIHGLPDVLISMIQFDIFYGYSMLNFPEHDDKMVHKVLSEVIKNDVPQAA